jgi:hypothetical protein
MSQILIWCSRAGLDFVAKREIPPSYEVLYLQVGIPETREKVKMIIIIIMIHVCPNGKVHVTTPEGQLF